MTIDWTKPILWDGKPARVLATDMCGPMPIMIRDHEGNGRQVDCKGRYYDDNRCVTNSEASATSGPTNWSPARSSRAKAP